MPKPPNQRLLLLMQYRDAGDAGLTDEEAAEKAKVNIRSCFWKRCSELRADRLIEQQIVDGLPVSRQGSMGVDRIVCVVTAPGRAVLEVHGL